MSEIILTYHSSTLRQADINLFSNSQWLNDQCILFYFEYLTHSSPREILFLDPGASFLLLFENDIDDLREAMCNISLTNRSLIFSAINDNNDPTSSGGGHWTLMVYDVSANQGFYYDSLGMHLTNYQNSQNILSKLCLLLSVLQAPLIPVEITQGQGNGSDCGVYVLMISEEISKTRDTLLRNQERITREHARKFRINAKNLINSLI